MHIKHPKTAVQIKMWLSYFSWRYVLVLCLRIIVYSETSGCGAWCRMTHFRVRSFPFWANSQPLFSALVTIRCHDISNMDCDVPAKTASSISWWRCKKNQELPGSVVYCNQSCYIISLHWPKQTFSAFQAFKPLRLQLHLWPQPRFVSNLPAFKPGEVVLIASLSTIH